MSHDNLPAAQAGHRLTSDHHTPPAYLEQAFRKYLECGIFAHGMARLALRQWVPSVPKRLRQFISA